MELKEQTAAGDSSGEVSVVICVKNGEDIVGPCLTSVLINRPFEVIVVDGRSTDRTEEIVKSFPKVKWVSDEGRGIAYARRVGIENAKGNYVLFVGPDNFLDEHFIKCFVALKNEWGFHAASVQTRVYEAKRFWDKGLDFRWTCLMGKPGTLKVVGTPSLYDAALFKEVQFAADKMPNDDTDVAEQLVAKGYRLGLVPLLVYEQNGWTARSTWKRFAWYGSGDYFFYRKYSPVWTWRRKLLSITHPLRQTFRFSKKALREFQFTAVPWLLFAMVARYYGWISNKLKHS